MLKKFTPHLITGFSLVLLITTTAYSQEKSQRDFLKALAQKSSAEFLQNKNAAKDFATINNIPLTLESEGMYAELMRLDEFNRPQYYITDNVTAAASIKTQKLFPNAGFGFSLTGAGETINLWDAGAVLTTHQELTGRITQVDASPYMHYHSTHVAGTMVATGVVANSKGMAPAASLRAFDWNNDEAEMALEAANNALISNHSYSCVRGWLYVNGTWTWYGDSNISTTEDYMFGFYGLQARNWDIIANNAPYYLICKSAGNDRNEGPSGGIYPKDGAYDCIADGAVAKNVITIGAVFDIPNGYTQSSDVSMTNFSGWGPVDDGRIKPDLVANGVSVYSTTSTGTSNYTSLSGTSMSTPTVSGSLLLLQQHYHNLTAQHMRAATLKALAIHTADEAGSAAGPDYQFGWGLMNSLKAAQKITEDTSLNVIEEQTLQAGNTYTRSIYSPGNLPLKVTVVWNDPAGLTPAAALDPVTSNLINDLNVKLIRNGSTHYPWQLNPVDPASAATRNTGNHVDNVEQVLVDAPSQGIYTLVIDYTGTLTGGSQQFSVIISGIAETPAPAALTSVNGTLTYANTLASPLHNANVLLKQGLNTVGQDTTDMAGNFSFNNLESGTYLMGGATNSPWGGVNATDALMMVKHFMHINYLSGMNLSAADVDGNGYVNSIDAMLASRRFAGLISAFNAGDWVFQHDSAVLSGTGIVTKNYKAIVVGDVDGSYTPGTKESAGIEKISSGEIVCSPGQVIEIPVKVSMPASIAAMSLVLNIPDGIEEINSLNLSATAIDKENLVFNVSANQLKIAWFSLSPMNLSHDDILFHISLKISGKVRSETLDITLDGSGSLANENAEELTDVSLLIPKIRIDDAGFCLSQNIPNPCRDLTTITYHLDAPALVSVKVFNAYGQVTESCNMEVAGGTHSMAINTAGYARGTYYYQLEAHSSGNIIRETRKMLVTE